MTVKKKMIVLPDFDQLACRFGFLGQDSAGSRSRPDSAQVEESS